METIQMAKRLAELGKPEEACKGYELALRLQKDLTPEDKMEAALFVLQFGGDYTYAYRAFLELNHSGNYVQETAAMMTEAFYAPNEKLLRSHYENNCKQLKKYKYMFRNDFLPFEELPIRFYPFDDKSYVPYYVREGRFGEITDYSDPVISRSFFHDLENPILARDVYSQYELEYLNDNVRPSEYVAKENHIYLHYTSWAEFCAHLQVLLLRKMLVDQKFVFLIENEIEMYPIDFKEKYGIDYSRFPLKPVGLREINRLVWHTQLSYHNGGDFFNEVFDNHPNLIVLPSLMMSDVVETAKKVQTTLEEITSLREAIQRIGWPSYLVEELYHMRDRTEKDIVVALYLESEWATSGLDHGARIAPALFFQPHFYNIVYELRVNKKNQTVLDAKNYDEIHQSSLFRNFKYIKTFTPMRRFTTSHGASVRFMYQQAVAADDREKGKTKTVVSDAVMERILNRSFMIDPEDRLYHDSILVRFEDGKLNPRATFTALAAFLDLPYNEGTMSYCSEGGKPVRITDDGYAPGFSPQQVYKTYDEFANDSERYFIEYFLRDAYEYYGYGFHYYDGQPVDEKKAAELIEGFTTIDHYMSETWIKVFRDAEVSDRDGQRVDNEQETKIQDKLLEDYIRQYHDHRLGSAKILLEGLHFVNKNGQPLYMMPMLEPDPELLENPVYR